MLPATFEPFRAGPGGAGGIRFRVDLCRAVSFAGVRLARQGHFTFWGDDRGEHVVLDGVSGGPIGCASMDADWSGVRFQIVHGSEASSVFRILSEIAFRTLMVRRRRGLVLHAAGIAVRGRGLALVGRSGTGKSTQARLWVAHRGAVILNEDRPAVTLEAGRPGLYGTPWSGSSRNFRAASASLAGVVVLEQAPENRARRLDPAEAVPRLLPQVFTPYWSREGMDAALTLLAGLVSRVPMVLLQCRPEVGALTEVERILG